MGATSLLKVRAAPLSADVELDAPYASTIEKITTVVATKKVLFTGHLARSGLTRPALLRLTGLRLVESEVGDCSTGDEILAGVPGQVNFSATKMRDRIKILAIALLFRAGSEAVVADYV
jgi:hypothetical protein